MYLTNPVQNINKKFYNRGILENVSLFYKLKSHLPTKSIIKRMSFIVFLLEISPFCAVICLYLSWNQWKTSKSPRVMNKNSIFNSLAVQYCGDVLKRPYRPTAWAFSPLIHTAYSAHWPRQKSTMKMEYLEVSNGGIVGIIWSQAQSQYIAITEHSPIVVFITNPLVPDNCFQPYIEAARRNGFRPALFLCQESKQLQKIQESFTGSLDVNYNHRTKHEYDFGEAIDYIRDKYPRSLVYVVALSYGNATLFKFLTTDSKSRNVTGAACISPAWQKETARPQFLNHATQNGFGPSKNRESPPWNYSSILRKLTRHRYFSHPSEEHLQSVELPNEVFGRFKRLLTPTVVIYSKDDPLVSAEDRNRLAGLWRNSELLLVVETANGGHAGFLQGFSPQSWAANLVFQYFDAVGKFRDATVAKSLNS